MSRMKVATLVAAALFGLFSVAYATNNVRQMPDGTYQNVVNGQACDANGNALTLEASKDRDNYTRQLVCNDTLTTGAYCDSLIGTGVNKVGGGSVFTAESSLVLPCAQYHHFTLWVTVEPPPYTAIGSTTADTAAVVRLAVEVRKHYNMAYDSTSSAVWQSWTPIAAAGWSADSTVSAINGTGGSYMATFPGERIISFPLKYGRGWMGVRNEFGWPYGAALDLVDSRGVPFWGEYVSIRIRCLTTGLTNKGAKPLVRAYLEMGS